MSELTNKTRGIHAPRPKVNELDTIVPINKGGTGATSVASAVSSLGLISKTQLNVVDGLAQLDENGKVRLENIDSLNIDEPAIEGPLSITALTPSIYYITDYDSFATYEISVDEGSLTIEEDKITYTPPIYAGVYTLKVNNKIVPITVTANTVKRPTIVSPVDNSVNRATIVQVTSSAFATGSGNITDSHMSSTWQISTDKTFNTILAENLNDTTNKTSYTFRDLNLNTTYYVRVKYSGVSFGDSTFSIPVTFTTKTHPYPSVEEFKLTASDKYIDNHYGKALAINADATVIVVGSPDSDVGTTIDKGTVYIYEYINFAWVETGLISGYSDISGISSNSLAITDDGKTIYIGDPHTDCVKVYTKVNKVWTLKQTVQPLVPSSGEMFGSSVSINYSGDKLIVGACNYNSNQGRVVTFKKVNNSYQQEQVITGLSGKFGYSVSISNTGDKLVIGSPYYNNSEGAIQIYKFSNNNWELDVATINITSFGTEPMIGYSVSMSKNSDIIAVGIPNSKYSSTGVASGIVSILKFSSNTWTEEQVIKPSTTYQQNVGVSVSLNQNGDFIIIGACGVTASVDNGRVYGYTRNTTGTSVAWESIYEDILSGSDTITSDRFGYSVALAGYGSKYVVGSPFNDPSGTRDAGAVYIYS